MTSKVNSIIMHSVLQNSIDLSIVHKLLVTVGKLVARMISSNFSYDIILFICIGASITLSVISCYVACRFSFIRCSSQVASKVNKINMQILSIYCIS